MQNRRKIILFIVFFIIGTLLLFIAQILRVATTKQAFIPQFNSVTLMPPTSAYSGIISKLVGEVKKQGRDADDFTRVASGAAVVQGESLATGNGITEITFPKIAVVSINQNSEIAFIDGIPQEFLLQQKSGKVTYQMLDDTKYLSVRSLHMLLQVAGKATVTTNPNIGSVMVEMQFGNGKIGINDLNNNTHIYQLAQGQKAIIDDASRSVDVE